MLVKEEHEGNSEGTRKALANASSQMFYFYKFKTVLISMIVTF